MSREYIIISLFGYRSIVSEEKRNAFLKVIYDGMSINRPKCFEEFINNTKNKLWREVEMRLEHKEKPKTPLRSLLGEGQGHLLMDWIEINHIDEGSIGYEDDLLNGVRVFGTQKSTDEKWEIDFTYEGGEK